jgi:hypothetical protein
MLKIINLRVGAMTATHMHVTWEVEPTWEDVLDYDLYVQRSESPEGPFDQVSDKMVDKYEFFDATSEVETRGHRLWYYRLRLVRRSTGEESHTGPSSYSAKPDHVATELRRQAMLLYKLTQGRRCWLFPVRMFGQRCKHCYDPVTNRKFKTECPQCYDTTWSRGYLDPIEVWVKFEPTPKHMENNMIRVEKMQDQVAYMGHYPEVKPLDMLVEPENCRWLVRRTQPTERLRAIVRQTLVMDEIEVGHINYQVPVNYEQLMHEDHFNPWLAHPSRTLGEGVPWS